MIRSGGVLTSGVKSLTTIWQGSPAQWPDWLSFRFGSYASIYARDLWVAVLVNKKGHAAARLPLKVYERGSQGREDASGSPYGQLLARPSATLDPYLFWLWVASSLLIYGEAFCGKRRDRGGRPVELVPLHPTRVVDELDNSKVRWFYVGDTGERAEFQRRDVVHFRFFAADQPRRGMSLLEPLRSTLENEYGARAANNAMWRNGGRPSIVLEHPKELSDAAMTRLSTQWREIHGGVDNWAKAAILEDGMTARPLPLNVEELQYVEARRLNREEACALYDVPPPVVHILDRATFSNITAQMRSMYRDTMAPLLNLMESTLEFELRDGRFGEVGDPDFGDDVYSEFLMDEVLRGDFEQRMTAYQQADFMTIAEKRAKENLPFIDGTDRLFINSASMPLASDGTLVNPRPSESDLRSVNARIGRANVVGDIDLDHVVRGLSPAGVAAVLDAYGQLPVDAPVDDIRSLLRGVT